jgi:hypothetical protein
MDASRRPAPVLLWLVVMLGAMALMLAMVLLALGLATGHSS